MGLKLFIKDNWSLVVFELFIVLFILSVYWLDGFRNINTAIYTIIISLILTVSYLGVRYFFRHRYLNKITQLPFTMEDALQKNAKSSNIFKRNNFYKNYIECINMKYKLCMPLKQDMKSF